MRDTLLLLMRGLTTGEKKLDIPVTLTVGGVLISGFLTTYEDWLKQNPIADAFHQNLHDQFKEELARASDDEIDQHVTTRIRNDFIHLRDARYFTPGQVPIPGNEGVYVRIPADAVQAWHAGYLSMAPK